jgi:hypothetical protein
MKIPNICFKCQKCAGSMGILVSADAKELGVFLDRNKVIPYCSSCHKRGVYNANKKKT